jgi:hypothetical protein
MLNWYREGVKECRNETRYFIQNMYSGWVISIMTMTNYKNRWGYIYKYKHRVHVYIVDNFVYYIEKSIERSCACKIDDNIVQVVV